MDSHEWLDLTKIPYPPATPPVKNTSPILSHPNDETVAISGVNILLSLLHLRFFDTHNYTNCFLTF
jgi:hypothetical protein